MPATSHSNLNATLNPAASGPRVLLADDQPDVLEALRLLLKGEGFVTEAVNSPTAAINALAAARERRFDLMLMDLNYTRDTTSGAEGLALIEQVRRLDATLPVVVMTAWGSVGLAVEAMREGGCDFIEKPWDNERLLGVVRAQFERGRRLRRGEQERQAAERQLRFEAEEARRIQESLLPASLPQRDGLEVAVSWQPMRAVGGDYFDVIELSRDGRGGGAADGPVAVCIADVVGKGLPAAMLMANLQAAVRALAHLPLKPHELCERLNRVMWRNSPGHRLITFCYAVVDARRGRLSYANAGHHAPLLVGRDGSVRRLAASGLPLHLFTEAGYETHEVELRRGDRLLMVTDGAVECCNAAGEEFGEERLRRVLLEHRRLGAAALQQAVTQAVTEFAGGDWRDDVTVLALSYE